VQDYNSALRHDSLQAILICNLMCQRILPKSGGAASVFTWRSTLIRRSLVSGRYRRHFGQTLRHYNPTHRRPIETNETKADSARHAN
jgi:hypothetical protein